MTKSKSVLIVGAGHNGLVCATYLAKAGHNVEVLEVRDTVGGGASTHQFAEGFKVSSLAHILHSLNPKVIKDLGLKRAGLAQGKAIDTISLAKDGRHLTLCTDTVSGEGLSDKDISTYATFKKEFRRYAGALEPMTMNKPPRLKDMDTQDKFTLAKLGWKLRFGLGTKSMREFLRVGGINMYDVLNDEFDDDRLMGAMSVDAVMGSHMGPRTPNTVLTYLHRLRGETNGPQTLPTGSMGQIASS